MQPGAAYRQWEKDSLWIFPVAIPERPCTNFHYMVPDWLQRLLVLQDRDLRCDSIMRQIEAIPGEIAKEKAGIEQLEAALVEKDKAAKQLEVRRLDLEGEVAAAEEQIVKYKTQQMQVKKNEEYTALEHEIKTLQEKVSELEDNELQIMEQAEIRQGELEQARKITAQERHTLEAHIELLKVNLASFSAELDAAKAAVADCEVGIDDPVLQQYRYVKSQIKRPPVVVELSDGRCQGCHLRVSGEVESAARRGQELVRCDSCGRILYYDR
jgi:predicted  nucleic acid-binding Zn-ribbon protein